MPFRIFFVLLFTQLVPVSCSAGDGKPISITVAADHTKANGQPWDGIPGPGVGRGRSAIPLPKTNAPPDLAVCVVRMEAPPECSMRYEAAKQYSLCQNSYDCIFRRVSIPDGAFGLIILDLDLQRHDLVDLLILTAGKALTPDELGKLEIETRRRADKLAPALFDREKQRRLSKMLVLPLDRCAGVKGCMLVQSEIRVNWAE
ncbi:hypothetical protein [Bradyrhizobium retamae]|uniref:Uncharacterized protein n=1 Tax=Bradyrhizobium retamae TaxID=1300035 RepID=A0A0R3MQK5_9BRAD|nr:hypothetical protein [Bradyrhizobium retamae]KRR22375.1 hypothetical protein CQ13_29410 [Bradyrhizobium retamae]